MLETKHNKLTVSSDTVRMSFLLTQAKCLLRIGTSGSLNEAEEILMKVFLFLILFYKHGAVVIGFSACV